MGCWNKQFSEEEAQLASDFFKNCSYPQASEECKLKLLFDTSSP